MKTEAEIRRHRDNLKTAMIMPCDCAGTGHSTECRKGLQMMIAVTETLSWVLGVNESMADLVAKIDADVQAYRSKLN